MKRNIILGLLACCLTACQPQFPAQGITENQWPAIYPDYIGVTIPTNTAPLNFGFATPAVPVQQAAAQPTEALAQLRYKDQTLTVSLSEQTFQFPAKRWKTLITQAVGDSIEVHVAVKTDEQWHIYRSFALYVAPEPMDSHVAYRKIAPGYELWKALGIYQRDLTSFNETPIVENRQTDQNCMNCHSFSSQQPGKFLFHMREANSGTYVCVNGKVEKLNTKTPETFGNLVYPSWHPGGRFVAFSINETRQFFHPNHRNRIEVYDNKSDVAIYDTERHELFSSPLLKDEYMFENTPTFSADGRTLYFCSAYAEPMPHSFRKVKFSLYGLPFNAETRQFGTQVDTLYNADTEGRSVTFPRCSPDGRYLLYTLSDFGYFTIWHKDADLYLIDLQTGQHRALHEVNSNDVESYHSWSSNSRWFVFSSRRDDGLYTRLYIAYISPDGQVGKPFMVPQEKLEYYVRSNYSYNIPEFVNGEVEVPISHILEAAKSTGTNINYVHP